MGRPTGTVTFLLTDLESSTQLWERHPAQMQAALARHDQLLRAAVAEHDGYVFSTAGDALAAAFARPAEAVAAAVDGQRRLRSEQWPDPVRLRARMGIHTGVTEERDGDYFGPAVNRAARICAAGHGGQVVVSAATAALLDDAWELDDLGAHRLKDLPDPQQLWQVIVDGDRDGYPPLRSMQRGHNLPDARTTFHGRNREIERLTEQLRSQRILTLTGPGGVGKTRLAIEIATGVLGRYGSVVFVDLSPVESEDAVTEAVLSAASLPVDVSSAAQLDKLVRAWRSRAVLLVLDNCEHLLDATAEVVDRIAAACPEVGILATSREALAVDGEHVHRLPSLEPQAAARLFIDRATAVRPDLDIDAPGAELIAEICQRLDGLPLALELAAARVSHMGLREIAANLDDRFRLLTGSRRRSLRRQQTLQATVDWSYDLLNDQERSLLRAAAVFVGGFDLPALAAIWDGDELGTADHLGSLIDKSLVVMLDESQATARYRLLESIRIYAKDRLVAAGEADLRRRAHADYFLSRARARPPRIADMPLWGVPLGSGPDLENHLAVLDWLDEQDELAALGQLAGRMATVLDHGSFLDVDARYLGRQDVAAALEDHAERALYLTASAANANYLGDYAEQMRFAEAAIEIAEDPATRGAAANWLSNAHTAFVPERAFEVIDVGLQDLPEDARVTRLMLQSQRALALIAQGRLAEAESELLPMADGPSVFPATELMLIRHVLGDDPLAGIPTGQGESQDDFGYRVPLVEALTAAAAGDHERAIHAALSAAQAIADYPVRLLDHDVLVGCAALAFHRGEMVRASRLLAVTGGHVRSPGSFAVYRHYRDLLREALPRERRRAITAEADGLEPFEVLEAELRRLRGEPSAAPVSG